MSSKTTSKSMNLKDTLALSHFLEKAFLICFLFIQLGMASTGAAKTQVQPESPSKSNGESARPPSTEEVDEVTGEKPRGVDSGAVDSHSGESLGGGLFMDSHPASSPIVLSRVAQEYRLKTPEPNPSGVDGPERGGSGQGSDDQDEYGDRTRPGTVGEDGSEVPLFFESEAAKANRPYLQRQWSLATGEAQILALMEVRKIAQAQWQNVIWAGAITSGLIVIKNFHATKILAQQARQSAAQFVGGLLRRHRALGLASIAISVAGVQVANAKTPQQQRACDISRGDVDDYLKLSDDELTQLQEAEPLLGACMNYLSDRLQNIRKN